MIEINLIAKKKSFKAPVVLGIDLAEVPWIKLIVSYIIYSNGPAYISDIWKQERESVQARVGALKKENKKLLADLKKNQNVEELLLAFNRQIRKLEERSKYVDKIIKDRTNPHMLLEKVARSTPDEVWFDELVINEKKEIIISGGSNNYKSIGDFLVEVNDSPFFKNSLQLKDSKTITENQQGIDIRVESFRVTGKIEIFDPFRQ